MPSLYPDVRKFNRLIIEATADLVHCYKPNIAFYSGAFRSEAQEVLAHTIDDIRDIAPSVPIILDFKRADIGNTNVGYVAEAFEAFGADAATINPYFGMEAMKPFLDQKDKGIIVLCRTSNPGAGEFQDVTLVATDPPNRSMQMYEYVAHRVASRWNYNGNCALVVGATAPEELRRVRDIVGDMTILIPGYGKQGGDLAASVLNGVNSKKSGIIINESSSVIFAANGVNFQDASRARVVDTTQKMNEILFTSDSFVDITA